MTINELVAKAKQEEASDIHLICGLPPKYRLSGQLKNMCEERLSEEDCFNYARFLSGNEQNYQTFLAEGELDAADTFADNRCRIHIFMQQGVPSVTLRLLREEIPKLDTLGLPPAAMNLTELHKGIVLIMVVTDAIRNLIRAGNTPQIANAIATSASIGGQTMDQCLVKLVRAGQISRDTAMHYAKDAEYIKKNSI